MSIHVLKLNENMMLLLYICKIFWYERIYQGNFFHTTYNKIQDTQVPMYSI